MNQFDDSIDISQTVRTTINRREFSRLPPQFESVTVRTKSGVVTVAKVENVSLGGIGLQLETNIGIIPNDEVDVIYLYVAMPAVVRHIQSPADGSVVAGLEWINRMESPE